MLSKAEVYTIHVTAEQLPAFWCWVAFIAFVAFIATGIALLVRCRRGAER